VFDVASFLDFAAPRGSQTARRERELWKRVERFGNVAHVFSAYELTMTSTDNKIVTRHGVNSIQLFYDGARWFITSLV